MGTGAAAGSWAALAVDKRAALAAAGNRAGLAGGNRPTVVDRRAGNRAALAAGNRSMGMVPAAATVSADTCLTDRSRSPLFSTSGTFWLTRNTVDRITSKKGGKRGDEMLHGLQHEMPRSNTK
jgi:hypothetical protein